jgi:hypothetical protein
MKLPDLLRSLDIQPEYHIKTADLFQEHVVELYDLPSDRDSQVLDAFLAGKTIAHAHDDFRQGYFGLTFTDGSSLSVHTNEDDHQIIKLFDPI